MNLNIPPFLFELLLILFFLLLMAFFQKPVQTRKNGLFTVESGKRQFGQARHLPHWKS